MSELLDDLRGFIHREARLLDQRRFADWLALYSDEATYWIPRQRGQRDAVGVPSIVYEDRSLLAIRVARLADPAMHAAAPAIHTVHVVGGVDPEPVDSATQDYRVISSQLVVASREAETRLYAGQCEHLLRRQSGTFTILRKRFDLVDCDAVRSPMPILL